MKERREGKRKQMTYPIEDGEKRKWKEGRKMMMKMKKRKGVSEEQCI